MINGLIRRFIPKGSDISKLFGKKISEIENYCKTLPRKILNCKHLKNFSVTVSFFLAFNICRVSFFNSPYSL